MILWKGKSQLNRQPIVLIATGLHHKTNNPKTGDMVQTWILVDNGHSPYENTKSGDDKTVCGNCKHRPANQGTCYVRMDIGVAQVYKAYHAGKYEQVILDKDTLATLFSDRRVRIGSYGNPSAVPKSIWKKILKYCNGWTAYDHEWRKQIAKPYQHFAMASVDNLAEKDEANKLGWRTFRVMGSDEELEADEVLCPASVEAGYKSVCDKCLLCSGAQKKAKNIAIYVHGSRKKKFISLPTV